MLRRLESRSASREHVGAEVAGCGSRQALVAIEQSSAKRIDDAGTVRWKTSQVSIDASLVARLYAQAHAERWRVSPDRFGEALEASVRRAFASRDKNRRDVERYLSALHLEDLALACGCAAGDPEAWDHFMVVHRPILYRAADALEPGGGARDLADSLYGELFGLREQGGERQSLFRYFHGRSSLRTWLRAILSQRHVDRVRSGRRLEGLPDEQSSEALSAVQQTIEPERDRYVKMVQDALTRALADLAARDRLRLACYYAQDLTLAQTARLLGEHEATSSRQLNRTRRALRENVEQQLRVEQRLTEAEISQCFASVAADPGPLNLGSMLSGESERKESALDRSR
jgi:RNA polymerase sigma factor (sigma-70 family)